MGRSGARLNSLCGRRCRRSCLAFAGCFGTLRGMTNDKIIKLGVGLEDVTPAMVIGFLKEDEKV